MPAAFQLALATLNNTISIQSPIQRSPRQSPRKAVAVSDICWAHRAKLWNEQVFRSSRKLCLIFISSAFRSGNYRRAFKYVDRCAHYSNNDLVLTAQLRRRRHSTPLRRTKMSRRNLKLARSQYWCKAFSKTHRLLFWWFHPSANGAQLQPWC